MQALRHLGWSNSHKITTDYRWSEGSPDHIRRYAADGGAQAGSHLRLRHRDDAGRFWRHQEGEHWSIVVPPEETKTNTGLEFEIPEDLRECLSNYFKRVRPRMLKVAECNSCG